MSATGRRRWAAVTVGAALLGAVVTVGSPTVRAFTVGSDGAPLPARELLSRAQASDTVAYTALAQSRGTLGLPDLPRFGAVAALLGGPTRARVWWVAPSAWRVDVLSATGEQGTYGTSGGVVTWDYERNALVRVVGEPGARLPRADDLLAPQATRRLLAGVGANDQVDPLPTADVDGRTAWGVRVVPSDRRSTIAQADVWVDAQTALPLRLRIVARGGEDALVTQLSDVQFGAPGRKVLVPPEPAGADVDIEVAPDLAASIDQTSPWLLPETLAGLTATRSLLQGTATYGNGLVRFVVLPLPHQAGHDVFDNARAAGAAPLDVVGGAAVTVSSSLLNAVAAQGADFRHAYLIAGLVDPELLRQAVNELFADPPQRRP